MTATLIITSSPRSITFSPDAHAKNPRLANIERIANELYKRRTAEVTAITIDGNTHIVEIDPAITDEEAAAFFGMMGGTPTALRFHGGDNGWAILLRDREPIPGDVVLTTDLTSLISPAVADEREACAKIASSRGDYETASAIRVRATK